jgi:hypothetical protein
MAIALDLGSLILTKLYVQLIANQYASDSFWKKVDYFSIRLES